MSQEPVRYWVPRSAMVGKHDLLRQDSDVEVVLASAYDALARELADSNASLQIYMQNCDALKEQLARTEQEMAAEREKVKRLEADNTKLRATLSQAQEESGNAFAQYARERERVKGLEVDQKLLCGRAWQVERIVDILQDVDNEYEPSDEAKEDSVIGEVWKWKQQLATLTAERDALKKALDATSAEVIGLNAANAKLRKENAKLASQCMGLS